MNNTRPINIQEMKQVLDSTGAISFQAANQTEMYQWIETTLRENRYLKLQKKPRGIVRRYVMKMTGLKKSQVTKLITQFKTTTRVKAREYRRHSFPRRYTSDDIARVAEADLALRK